MTACFVAVTLAGMLVSGKPAKDAEKLTPEEQRRRFIEAAREAGASEDEAAFDASLKRIARPVAEKKQGA